MKFDDFITELYEENPDLRLKKSEMKFIVNAIFAKISKIIINKDEINFRNFGVFKSYDSPATVARNPRTGEKINVPAKIRPHFKFANFMKKMNI